MIIIEEIHPSPDKVFPFHPESFDQSNDKTLAELMKAESELPINIYTTTPDGKVVIDRTISK